MNEISPFTEDDNEDVLPSEGETKLLREGLVTRSKAAGFESEEVEDPLFEETTFRLAMPCGREKRWLIFTDYDELKRVSDIPFEKYTFLSGLDAICNYSTGDIEALISPLASMTSPRLAYSRLFGITIAELRDQWSTIAIAMESPPEASNTSITLSPVSKDLHALIGSSEMSLSIKIRKVGISQHDQALQILRKTADSVFFQVDLISQTAFTLSRDKRFGVRRKSRPRGKISGKSPEFPRSEYDSAPMSLYWYARSAIGLPLLQFLAYYQVIEYYYPTYALADAGRKLKLLIKDPSFRADRDADIGKVLSAIQVSRSGGFGDERTQLKATLSECVDANDLRHFLTSDEEMVNFLSSKTKGLTDHKLPISNEGVDLRPDVAERIYDIRCRIVHTKIDARSGELELLLPFSKEAEQLHHDIQLAKFLAQRVLVAASTPFQG